MKLLNLLIVSVLMGCASFLKNDDVVRVLEDSNLVGEYFVNPIFDSLKRDSDFHSIFDKFHWDYGRGIVEIQEYDKNAIYSFELKNKGKYINVSYRRNNDLFKEFNLIFILKPDGYWYLKNENTKINGVPYIFGGIDVKRIRIRINNDNYLLV